MERDFAVLRLTNNIDKNCGLYLCLSYVQIKGGLSTIYIIFCCAFLSNLTTEINKKFNML